MCSNYIGMFRGGIYCICVCEKFFCRGVYIAQFVLAIFVCAGYIVLYCICGVCGGYIVQFVCAAVILYLLVFATKLANVQEPVIQYTIVIDTVYLLAKGKYTYVHFPALAGTLTIGHYVPPCSMLNNVMLHSIKSQCRLCITVTAMLVLTGCSANINWFPSSQFTTEDWRRNPILSVTQQCLDDFVATRTIMPHRCAELRVTVAEF